MKTATKKARKSRKRDSRNTPTDGEYPMRLSSTAKRQKGKGKFGASGFHTRSTASWYEHTREKKKMKTRKKEKKGSSFVCHRKRTAEKIRGRTRTPPERE